MLIAIPKETREGETRVAATPEIIKKYIQLGFDVQVQTSAGLDSGFSDKDYQNAGAQITPNQASTYKGAQIILKIWAPDHKELSSIEDKSFIFANFQAYDRKTEIPAFASKGITCFALDLMPRISRAQSMDILSSQSNLAGYKAVLEALNYLPSAAPMMMTAAGTIAPAKALILGAGVAGLQAIATAKRLGAVVYASDVRPQVKEQVESLGAKFLDIKTDESFETSGGYAKETSKDYQAKQHLTVAEQLTKTNFAITTALIPGRPAPLLITKEMLQNMPSGSVIVDMATSHGGNVEGSQDNAVQIINDVIVIGNSNLAAKLPASASPLFAKNIFNFIETFYDKAEKILKPDFNDQLIKSTCLCHDKKVIHPAFIGA